MEAIFLSKIMASEIINKVFILSIDFFYVAEGSTTAFSCLVKQKLVVNGSFVSSNSNIIIQHLASIYPRKLHFTKSKNFKKYD